MNYGCKKFAQCQLNSGFNQLAAATESNFVFIRAHRKNPLLIYRKGSSPFEVPFCDVLFTVALKYLTDKYEIPY